MKRKAYGKINLGLNVIRRREDGFHDLDMIMAPIDLYDEIEMEVADETSFESDADLPWDSTNTIYRTLEVLKKAMGIRTRFRIRLEKNIPMAAGLAGGSADAAAVLHLVNDLLGFRLTDNQLAELGALVGSDVPFCVINRSARVQGRGERVIPFRIRKQYDVLLVKPDGGVSTKEAYRRLRLEKCPHPDMNRLMEALETGKPLNGLMGNSLEESGFRLNIDSSDIKHECLALGYENSLMSGSGSTVFVLTGEGEDTSELEAIMKNKYNYVIKTKILNN